jgi:hypothetical protein
VAWLAPFLKHVIAGTTLGMTTAEPSMERAVRTATLPGPDFDFFGNYRISDNEAGEYFCLQWQSLKRWFLLRGCQ